jgi:diguanylate cyclase (GGDEF)-like protein
MTKRTGVIQVYMVLVVAVICISLALAGMHRNVDTRPTKMHFMIMDNIELTTVDIPDSPLGYGREFSWTVSGIEDSFNTILFYSYHQNVVMILDGQEAYRSEAAFRNLFGKGVGCIWNRLVLKPEDNGKELRIQFLPVYEGVDQEDPVVYIGSEYDIVRDVVADDTPILLTGFLALIVGTYYVFYSLMNFKRTKNSKNLLWLGVFALEIGLWKVVDAPGYVLLRPNSFLAPYLPHMLLLLICIPAILFFKELVQNKESAIWYILCTMSAAGTSLILILQVLNIFDFRQLLPVNQAMMAICASSMLIITVRDWFTVGLSKEMRRNSWGLLACFIGLTLDVVLYYVQAGNGARVWGMVGFLLFILILGYNMIQETRHLLEIGEKAESYERMAFHDQLTGVYNRAAYAYDIAQSSFDAEQCMVVMFDLNNLKKVNDTKGHDAGDTYIKESCLIIQRHFGRSGNIYRIGGDEFICLIHHASLPKTEEMVKEMQEACDKWNKENADMEIFMQIACGYEMYSPSLDYDILDTVRRADKMMYQNKFDLKEKVRAQATAEENRAAAQSISDE